MVSAAIKIKRRLLLGRKAMTNLDSILKSRDAGTEPRSPALQADSLPYVPPGKPNLCRGNALADVQSLANTLGKCEFITDRPVPA